jgi:outer membrane autotransporter protein
MLAGNFTGTVQPYGVIGIGANFISASVSQNNVTVSQSETDMGLGLGGGISFVVSPKVNLYLETQYNFIFNEDGAAKGYLPIRGGVSFRVN